MDKIKIFLIIVICANIQVYGQYSGQIISEDGLPLNGVHVCSESWGCSVSNSDGLFSHLPAVGGTDVLNFSRDGFIPLTVIVPASKHDMEIVLKYGESGTWNIPICTDRNSYTVFGRFGLKIPKKTKVNNFHDIDYAGSYIRNSNNEFLRVGGGSSWSKGFPSAKRLKESKQLFERILVLPNDHEDVESPFIRWVDFRGIYEDGSYWRYTGYTFQTFDYDHVSKEAAEFFDSILNTLCVMAH